MNVNTSTVEVLFPVVLFSSWLSSVILSHTYSFKFRRLFTFHTFLCFVLPNFFHFGNLYFLIYHNPTNENLVTHYRPTSDVTFIFLFSKIQMFWGKWKNRIFVGYECIVTTPNKVTVIHHQLLSRLNDYQES